MKLKDVLAALAFDDNGDPFDLDAEVEFCDWRGVSMDLLSVYIAEDNEGENGEHGLITVDIGDQDDD